MKIVRVEAWSVAIPFRNPIESAYGISFPARVRTIIRLTTDEGVTGIGETGPSPLAPVAVDGLAPRFEREVAPQILGADPAHTETLRARLGWGGDATAVELACHDILGKATSRPVFQLLGGQERAAPVPVSGYVFFMRPDRDGHGGVTPENVTDAVRALVSDHGFTCLKLKLGVYPPAVEVQVVNEVREAFPDAQIRVDPNGAWSLPTALRVMRQLDAADLEYVEDPTKDSPLGLAPQVGGSVDLQGYRRLREASSTPLCCDSSYRLDQLRAVIREQAADVVLADVIHCGGLRATMRWYQTADLFHLGLGMHSGTELGIGQLAKLHAIAAMGGRVQHASDAIYPHYVDDVLTGGKLPIRDGVMEVPSAPGLGGTLDESRLATWELNTERMHELNDYWQELQRAKGIGERSANMLVRGY